MFAILPFILLLIRWFHFRRLSSDELPRLSEDDLKKMRDASATALYVMLAFTVLSFVPYALIEDGSAQLPVVLALGFIGLFIAAFFDLKAEKIKRRGRPEGLEQPTDVVRWYHVLVAIMLPYVALPWGIVNLVRKRHRTGLVLVLVPVFFGIVIAICLIAANASGACAPNLHG